jgi:hypothetical protein
MLSCVFCQLRVLPMVRNRWLGFDKDKEKAFFP